LDILAQQVEIAPTAHFMMGGVPIDALCQTGLIGLYAAGEVTAGAHGANRLGNNALTEALVFGAIAGREAAQFAAQQPARELSTQLLAQEAQRITEPLGRTAGDITVVDLRKQINKIMWDKVGVVRLEKDLEQAAAQLSTMRQHSLHRVKMGQASLVFNMEFVLYQEAKNMLLAGEAIARAASIRRESRGAHYITDYPARNDRDWLVNTVTHMQQDVLETDLRPANLIELWP
jgi:fumarate reductase (CoM/CoB) subunit A